MREPADIGKIEDLRETILRDYRMKVVDLGYDDTRHRAAEDALHSLGYERHDCRRWLASKAQKR